MYVFSVNAVAREAMDDINAGQTVPCIVYINAPKLDGAQRLCTHRLMRAGFVQIEIEQHKKIAANVLADKKQITAHSGLREALEKGYAIHVFEEH